MDSEGARTITILGAIILAVMAVGVIVLIVYFLIYKSSINKTVTSREGTGGHRRLPAPASAAKTVIAVVIAAVIIALWFDIKGMKESIGYIRGNYDRFEQRIASLEGEIDILNNKLEKEQSIFSSVDISFGKPDLENHSVKISVTAAPKSCTEEAEVSIALGDNSAKLSKVGTGLFSGEIEVDFYKEYNDISLITVTDGGKTVSEELYLYGEDIRQKYGAEISERIEGFNYQYQSGRLNISTSVFGYEKNEDFFDLNSLKLILEAKGSIIFEEKLLSESTDLSGADFFTAEKSCEVPQNTIVTVYFSAVDKCGNTHICRAELDDLSSEGCFMLTHGGEKIYDGAGNLIAEF